MKSPARQPLPKTSTVASPSEIVRCLRSFMEVWVHQARGEELLVVFIITENTKHEGESNSRPPTLTNRDISQFKSSDTTFKCFCTIPYKRWRAKQPLTITSHTYFSLRLAICLSFCPSRISLLAIAFSFASSFLSVARCFLAFTGYFFTLPVAFMCLSSNS